MIYFAQAIDGGPVKIGYSADVMARARQLESHYGRPLAILATMKGDRPEEAELHARFAHLRLGRTEQFRPAPDLMAFIGRPLLVGANPDAVEAMPPGSAVMNIRGSLEWRQWLERGAEHCLTDVSKLVDVAVSQYLKAQGFEEPRPKR